MSQHAEETSVTKRRSGARGRKAAVAPPRPEQNQLLAALPQDVRDRIFSSLEFFPLPLGKCLYESGDELSHVYFPTDSIVSLLYVMEDGASAEISVVGNEGVVGVSLFMGGGSTPSRAVVQSGGQSYRLPARLVRQEFDRHGDLLVVMLRYTQALITQMAQTAVCNRHHTIDQQLCRWLLMSLDRLPGNTLVMTQELIANMLGVRREGVTEAAGRLQRLGVITYRRGHITVLDRPTLEKLTCECYEVVKRETDRLVPYGRNTRAAPPVESKKTPDLVRSGAQTADHQGGDDGRGRRV
ncbi:MAG: Crp/Fnr family transcriptional regulator [Gammaproteobacteria bacterium]|nr:Crp/Fnr family transcriptional regulator [Gammaproteobacteria bacterium]